MGNERELLDSLGMTGWEVKSRTPGEPEKYQVTDPDDPKRTITKERPSGLIVWQLADGKGHFDEMTVSVSGTGGASTGYQFTPVKLPKNVPAASTTAKPTPAAGLEIIKDPTSGKPIKLRDPSTGTVIDLPDTPAGRGATVVQGPRDSVYSWDGTTLTPLLPATAEKPQIIQGQRGELLAWDGSTLKQIRAPEAKAPNIQAIGNRLVNVDTGQVVFEGPEGLKFQTAQDGSILAIDPSNPTQPQVVWKPAKAPDLVPGQSTNQPVFVTRDPVTGELSSTPNPIGGRPVGVSGSGPTQRVQNPDGTYSDVPVQGYRSAASQRFQDLYDGIADIKGRLARGEFTPAEADKYIGALRQNFDASLRGTTPYQEYQDRQARVQQRLAAGQSMLNQRVAAGSGLAQSLLNSAVGIVSNKNFMDPSAVAGFSPFSGAAQYVTDLGGGPGVYNAAANAVQAGFMPDRMQQSDPASALLQAALSGPPAAPGVAGPAQPAYGGENIGSGAASNPQPPMQLPIQRDPGYLNDQRHLPPTGGQGFMGNPNFVPIPNAPLTGDPGMMPIPNAPIGDGASHLSPNDPGIMLLRAAGVL